MTESRDGIAPFVPVVINAILHDCRKCGHAVPVNGLVSETTCPHCLAAVDVPLRQWKLALHTVSVGALVTPDEKRSLNRGRGRKNSRTDLKLLVDWRVRSAPKCLSCDGALDADEASWEEPELSLTCGDCGTSTRFGPPGLDLEITTTTLTHVAAFEGASAGGAVVATVADGARPIAMSCPSCAAGLQITVEDQRSTTCTYCDASVYIPDDLWRLLHPVKQAQDWNAVFHLTPDALRAAATRTVGCTVALILLAFGGMFVGLSAGFMTGISEGQILLAVLCGTLLLLFGGIALAVIAKQVQKALRFRRLATSLE